MSNLIGRRLGRYEIRSELGRGGMARVYQALDTQLQRTVAIKVLAAQLSLDPEFVRRFQREASTAASLAHPAIVKIYDFGEQDGLHYIAMEYVAGRSLHAILEERTALGLGFAINILDPVASALDYAHSRGAVHRDIKPHNIMIDRTGRVLLTDFGIVQTPDADSERLTRTGVFMGTPEYISPEQAEARRVDGRSDLYSLGVVAYEVITGRVPFAGATPQLIVAHAQLPPPPPTSVAAHLPGELDTVLARALAKRPEKRYASGGELVEALRTIARRYNTPLATADQLAGLATVAGSAPIPRPQQPGPPAAPRPAAPPRPDPAAPRPDQSLPRQSKPATRPDAGRATGSRTGQRGSQRGGPSVPALLLIGGLLVGVTLLLLFAVAQGLAGTDAPTPTAAAATPALPSVPPPSDTAAPPTAAPTAAPTDAPTELPVELPIVVPTAAPIELPTIAPPPPPPPPTLAPTAIPIPATDTPEPPTPIPPTETPTEAPPSETPTLAPPSETPTPPSTNTSTPPPTDTAILENTAEVVTPVTPAP